MRQGQLSWKHGLPCFFASTGVPLDKIRGFVRELLREQSGDCETGDAFAERIRIRAEMEKGRDGK